jgi:hypothetical protein
MDLQAWAARALLLLGVGFLIANARIGIDLVRFIRRRSSALLVWAPGKPPFYRMGMAIGAVLGALLLYDFLILRRPVGRLFGVGMMFLYYSVGVPLGRLIQRGFYQDGIWAEGGFIPYEEIGAISWREGQTVTLLIASRARSLARHLVVPSGLYGAARRQLRDKVAAHDIRLGGAGLGLGTADEKDAV